MRHALALAMLLLLGCGKSDPIAFGPGVHDFNFPLVGTYSLWRTSAHEVKISPSGYDSTTAIIPPKVIEVAWDSRFIIAKRQALKLRDESQPSGYQIPVEGKFDFWILDTQPPKVFGPFDETTFVSKRKELGVSEALLLKDVYLFRPK